MNAIMNAPRWANYFMRQDPGRKKPSKVPTIPSNQPDNWLTYQEAVRRDPTRLAFLLGDGWCGVDLDDVEHAPLHSQAVLESFRGAYTEQSISGRGWHVIGRAPHIGMEFDYDSPRGINPLLWTSARFFVFTGLGSGDPEQDITAPFDIWAPAATVNDLEPRATGYAEADYLSDDDVLTQAAGSANGAKFLALWRGDWQSLGYKSQSEADLALACILAFWTNNNEERVDRLFRLSNLYRDKWNVATYRYSTIRKAVRR